MARANFSREGFLKSIYPTWILFGRNLVRPNALCLCTAFAARISPREALEPRASEDRNRTANRR